MNNKKEKKKNKLPVLTLIILVLSIGYALLSQELSIHGTSQLKDSKWNIHWDNVQVNSNSVSGTSVTQAAQITNTEKTLVEYSITLSKPGEFYEFTVDAKNEGTVDGMVNAVSNKVYESNGTTEKTLPAYLTYSVTYNNGKPIDRNHLLSAGATEKYKVRVEFKDVEASLLPTQEETIKFKFSVDYVQADDNATAPYTQPENFETDDWETVIEAIKSGDTDNYNVGDEKEVDLGTLGKHRLRIANKSTPAECSNEGFSQSACGFVLEFADIITKHNMNPSGTYKGHPYSYGWNGDGWPGSSMYTYVNTDIYNALPENIRTAIVNTKVVSGHGSTSGENNFTSTDKLYLLSAVEVWGNNANARYDTAKDLSRQMDYYSNLGVDNTNYSGVIKQYNGSNSWWWLRSANSDTANGFYYVNSNGNWNSSGATGTGGVSPAFRIG